MITLIGSTAAKHWFEDFRDPKDVDYHSGDARARLLNDYGYDVFVDESLSQWDWGYVATPEELYTMKVSHSYWEIENTWNKHMGDIIFFQRKKVEFIKELHDILVPIWKGIHGRKITSLNQGADTFFSDGVNRKYDHDSIHDSVAYFDKPLYESILIPGESVMVDNEKFFNMDYDIQLKLVREEVYATALERILIPNDYKGSPGAAYSWALRRTITSLFKGDWALWAVLNYDRLAKPDCNYMKRHLENKDRLILL